MWIEKIELNEAIGEANAKFDLTREEEPMPQAAKDILCAAIAKSIWLARFQHDIAAAKSIAEANRILDRVFDAADRHRVWCGMPS